MRDDTNRTPAIKAKISEAASAGELGAQNRKQVEGMQKRHHEHEDEILSSTPMYDTLSSASRERELVSDTVTVVLDSEYGRGVSVGVTQDTRARSRCL